MHRYLPGATRLRALARSRELRNTLLYVLSSAFGAVLGIVTLLRLPQGNQVAVVVLGAGSNNGRFWETRHLFNWLTDKASVLFTKEAIQQVP